MGTQIGLCEFKRKGGYKGALIEKEQQMCEDFRKGKYDKNIS